MSSLYIGDVRDATTPFVHKLVVALQALKSRPRYEQLRPC